MRVTTPSALCDAIEVGTLQLTKSLSVDDIVDEALQGYGGADPRDLVRDSLRIGVRRANICPRGYPFDVSERVIQHKPSTDFNLYLFLLCGCLLKEGGATVAPDLPRRFAKYFEDVVCWALRRAGFTAEVLSEPREERGLERSLIPSLRVVATRFGEVCDLLEEKVTAHDNDLGVDVLATVPQLDMGRSGRPFYLFQCATGPIDKLASKMMEDERLFPSVWNWGFYRACGVRGGATPYDLLGLERVYWDRLGEQGWVLDRTRLVALAENSGMNANLPRGAIELWDGLRDAIPDLDWRNGWQYSL